MVSEHNVEVIPGATELGKCEPLITSCGVLLSDEHARALWKLPRDLITRKRVCCKQSARFGDVWQHKYLAPISGLATFSQPSTAVPVHYYQITSSGQHSEETLHGCHPIAQSVDSCTAQQPGYWCT
ncbi:uncharacterized protein ARMOST_17041 [Armillaria ostoyae]|uniref:Uncharacterized protein n=1 Tax=Armillaria ostoyae TaxID=47428 RepID=A0A284RXW6_ARMOS|nr:uncharacterized protein ARMOST_17041 [Armillaria ostoyae]